MTFRVSPPPPPPPPPAKRSSGGGPKRPESPGDVSAAAAAMMMKRSARDAGAALPARSTLLPYIPSLTRSTDGARRRAADGCPNFTKSLLATKRDVAGGRHFLFDKTYDQLQRTRTLIPPLPTNYHHVHRPGDLRPIAPPLAHGRPLPLGSCEGYGLGTAPPFLLPSALVLNKRNTFSVDQCLLNRPKVSQRTYNLLTIRDIQRGQGSFPDPVAGAPYPFLQRVSELSSLEGETARQEKLVRMGKHRKQEWG